MPESRKECWIDPHQPLPTQPIDKASFVRACFLVCLSRTRPLRRMQSATLSGEAHPAQRKLSKFAIESTSLRGIAWSKKASSDRSELVGTFGCVGLQILSQLLTRATPKS